MQGELLDIDCRVDVAVVVSTAVRTDPFSLCKNKILLDIPTTGTDFRPSLLVCPDLLLQRKVIHKPTSVDVLHERCNLLPIGIHPILVGLEHTE